MLTQNNTAKNPHKFSQYLIDSARRDIGLNDRYINSLAAGLIHSVLFHDEIVYFDAYLVNNPYILKAIHKYPIIIDIFDNCKSSIAIINGNNSLIDNLSYLDKRDVFHPGFPGKKKELLDSASTLERIEKYTTRIVYDKTKYKSNYTELVCSFFRSDFFSKAIDVPQNDISDILNEILDHRVSSGGARILFQGDTEHANKPFSPFELKILERYPNKDIKTIRPVIHRFEQSLYRTSFSTVIESSIIMNPDMRQNDDSLCSGVASLSEKSVRIESPWFHSKNLLSLSIDDILNIRQSVAFHDYVGLRFSKNTSSIPGKIEELKPHIVDLIALINDRIKHSLPAGKRFGIQGRHLYIDFLIKSSVAPKLLSFDTESENFLWSTKCSEIVFKLIDMHGYLPSDLPTTSLIEQFVQNIYTLPGYAPVITAALETKAEQIQKDLDKMHGEPVLSKINEHGYSSY